MSTRFNISALSSGHSSLLLAYARSLRPNKVLRSTIECVTDQPGARPADRCLQERFLARTWHPSIRVVWQSQNPAVPHDPLKCFDFSPDFQPGAARTTAGLPSRGPAARPPSRTTPSTRPARAGTAPATSSPCTSTATPVRIAYLGLGLDPKGVDEVLLSVRTSSSCCRAHQAKGL